MVVPVHRSPPTALCELLCFMEIFREVGFFVQSADGFFFLAVQGGEGDKKATPLLPCPP